MRVPLGMLDFLRTRTRAQLATFAVVAFALLLSVIVTLSTSGRRPHSEARRPAAVSDASITPTTSPATASTAIATSIASIPQTGSADVYAAAVAQKLFAVDYVHVARAALMAFWRQQLATALPIGTPAGTTIDEAQDAAMSTIESYVASASMWPTLAQDRTAAEFHATSISEPAPWVSAVTAGKIADPGLTVRTVVGLQTITYGDGTTTQSTAQTQEVTIAMLCPPTTSACSLEIIPPRDGAGLAG